MVWPVKLVWVSTAPFGRPGGARGVHDQSRRVVGDVHRLWRTPGLVDQVFVAEHAVVRRRPPATTIMSSSGWMLRTPVATGASTASVIITLRFAVLDQEGDFGCGEPEVQRDRDGPEHVGRQHRLDELGAVEHQDHDPVPETDPSAAQRIGQRRNPTPQVGPGRRATKVPQRRGARLHQRVPLELVNPVLPASEIRLLSDLCQMAGQLRGQLALPFTPAPLAPG